MSFQPAFALWPIAPFGSEGNDDGGDGGNTGGDDGGASGDAGGDGGQGGSGKPDDKSKGDKGSGDGAGGDDDDDDLDEYKGLSVKELRSIAAKNAADAKGAEKKRAAAQAVIDAEARKKNDDVTNLKSDLSTANETIATLRSTVVEQAIREAIRDDDRYVWHDISMVAKVATEINPEIKVTDDGKVEGVKATLPKVAKQHAFMLKSQKDEGDGGKNNGGNSNGRNGSGGNGPSGFQPGQGGTSGGAGGDVDRKQLEENYPALAARI